MFGKTDLLDSSATFRAPVSPAWNGIYELTAYRRSRTVGGRLAAILGDGRRVDVARVMGR